MMMMTQIQGLPWNMTNLLALLSFSFIHCLNQSHDGDVQCKQNILMA